MTSPSNQMNGHVLRPDFIVRLHVGPDETTATLYAFRGNGAAAAAAAGLPRNAWNDVVDQHAPMPADMADVIAGHLNKSRVVYVNGSRPVTWFHHKDYDERGAMYFAIAVILFYGISIAMLVAASTLKRSHSDYELKGFLRSYARLDQERRSDEKQRVRDVLQRHNLLLNTTSRGSSALSSIHCVTDAAPRRPIFISAASRRHNAVDDEQLGITGCHLAPDEQPTVQVVISPAESGDAATGSDPIGYHLRLQTVADVGPSIVGSGVEQDRKQSDDHRAAAATYISATRLVSAISCGSIELGGSRVWPADEASAAASRVDSSGCRRELSRGVSMKSWWTLSRPVSDGRLSHPLSERSLLVGRTSATLLPTLHLAEEGWGWFRDGRRNTAV